MHSTGKEMSPVSIASINTIIYALIKIEIQA